MVLLFMLLAALIHLKPKVHNVATISAFAFFFCYIYSFMDSQLAAWSFLGITYGDVEISQGLRHNSGESFSICHWKLNSASVYNYKKLFSLKAHITFHKFDIICFSDTFLDSSVAPDDGNLEISDYSFV